MQRSFFGELFGVKIHLPISRNEVDELITAKIKRADQIVQKQSIPLHQALIQLDLEIHHFAHGMDQSQAKRFYEYLIEESSYSSTEKILINQFEEDSVTQEHSSEVDGHKEVKASIFSSMSWFLLIGCMFLTLYWFGLK